MPDCSQQHTAGIGVNNHTNASIVVCFVQGTSRYSGLPPEYVKNTGVIKVGENLSPGQSAAISDLCSEKGILILATAGSLSVKIHDNQGEYDVNFAWPEIAEGRTYTQLECNLGVTHGVTSTGSLGDNYTLGFKVDGSSTELMQKTR